MLTALFYFLSNPQEWSGHSMGINTDFTKRKRTPNNEIRK